MKRENLFNAIGLVSDEKIIEAELYYGSVPVKQRRFAILSSPLTALLATVLIVIGAFAYIYNSLPKPEAENLRGNSTGNSVNHGTSAFDGEWIYYFNETDSRHLYKIRNDDTEKTLISDEISGAGINVFDGWIYYLGYQEIDEFIDTAGDGGFMLPVMNYLGIFKCRTDGTEVTLLSTDGAKNLSVVGEWIYYISDVPDNALSYETDFIYKMRFDGTEKTQINNEISEHMNVDGDWIYYEQYHMGESYIVDTIYIVPLLDGIYKIRTDGTEKECVISLNNEFDNIYNMVVSDDWIYYSFVYYKNEQHYYEFYKIRTDGSENTLLLNEHIASFTVEGEWIYHISDGVIGKFRTDGGGQTILSEYDELQSTPNVVGDWIYLRNGGLYDLYTTWRISINGGELELVTAEERKPEFIQMGGYNWRVLTEQDSKKLIITENVVEGRPFHDYSLVENITWENCNLRTYLNGEFYNRFTSVEKELIVETLVINRDNSKYGTSGGNDTVDKIFLLSIEEAEYYFKDGSDRAAIDYKGNTVYWWLRSPGSQSGYTAGVYGETGTIDVEGGMLGDDGVRPAMWISSERELSENNKKALELIGYQTSGDGDIWTNVGDNWETCEPEIFREYMFGSWEGDAWTNCNFDYIENQEMKNSLIFDDSVIGFPFNLKYAAGYYRYGNTIIFEWSNHHTENILFWLDISEPDIMYMEAIYGYYIFAELSISDNSVNHSANILTRMSLPPNEPNGNMSRLSLTELSEKYGITYPMFTDISYMLDEDNSHVYFMDGMTRASPIYLVSEEAGKLVFKSAIIDFGGDFVDVTYTIEKINGEWKRTVELDTDLNLIPNTYQ